MWEKKIYVQHVAIEGLATAGGIQGTIADTCIALLKWWGIGPVFKWVDDFVLFRSPSPATTTTRSLAPNTPELHFPYDLATILEFTAPLSIPWHPVVRKGQDFGTTFSYVGFFWNVSDRTVSISEEKKMRVLAKVKLFLLNPSTRRKHWEVALVHGTLQHITFVYRTGRHHLAALSTFLSKFPNDHISHHMPHSTLTQLSWWKSVLSHLPMKCCLTPLLTINLDIYIDASTSWGIGLCVRNWWAAWHLVPGWNTRGRDIGWAEAVTLELATLWLAETDWNDLCAIIHSDNRGVIDAFNKGRSQNMH